jgi:hypothetical protein
MFKKTGKTTTLGIAEPTPKKEGVIGSVEGGPKIEPLDKDSNISIPRPTNKDKQ